MLGKKILSTVAAGVMIAASGTAGAAANFDNDVAASIDLGLAWLDSAGCFNGSYTCDDATGLALLALLEKRPTAAGAPQGYNGASAADQERMRRTVRVIIDQINAQGTTFYSYRDGAYMMALSVYMRSGGPDKDDGPTTELDGAPLTLKQALDKAFDRSIVAQLKNRPNATAPWPASNGYWYYTDVGSSAALYPDYYRDSSTTQLVVAGLASARGAYLSTAFADPARAAQLDAATALARTAYERNGTPGGACTADPQPANEKGHGYNAGDPNSIQQTASGLWIQLVGGAGLNWPGTQSYLRWLQNRYRWDNISSAGVDAGWGSSYWYYLWSSFKAYQFLIDANTTPSAGNIGVGDVGMLDPTAAPACAVRQTHRDPSALPRIALFGTPDSGFYSAEAQRVYFDYAYTIMGYQCANGYYNCNGAPGRWDTYAEQAYALLVLQRSVGGGCLDADRDGICDSEDPNVVEPPAPPPSGGLYCDRPTDGDTRIDNRDLAAIVGLLGADLQTGAADRGECLGELQWRLGHQPGRLRRLQVRVRQQVAQEVLLIRTQGLNDPAIRRVTLRRHPPFFIIVPCPVTNSSPAWRCCCCRRLPSRRRPRPRTGAIDSPA